MSVGQEPHFEESAEELRWEYHSKEMQGSKFSSKPSPPLSIQSDLRRAERPLDSSGATVSSLTISARVGTNDEVATVASTGDNLTMDYVPRQEHDAKLKETQAKVDLRLEQFQRVLAETLAAIRVDISASQVTITKDIAEIRRSVIDERVAITESIRGFKDEIAPVKAAVADLSKVRSSIRANAWGAAVTIIVFFVGSVLAAYALGFSAFESGRNTANLVNDAQKKVDEASNKTNQTLEKSNEVMNQVLRRLDAQQK